MKCKFKILLVAFLITNCVPSSEIRHVHYDEYVIDGNVKYHFPIRIENYNYECADTNFTIIGWTRSIPPHPLKKIKNFDFEIVLWIRNESKDSDWQRSLYIETDRLASDSDTLKLTRYGEVLYSNMLYTIPFKVTAAEGERVLFRLGFKNKVNEAAIFAEPDDPYRTFDIIF